MHSSTERMADEVKQPGAAMFLTELLQLVVALNKKQCAQYFCLELVIIDISLSPFTEL